MAAPLAAPWTQVRNENPIWQAHFFVFSSGTKKLGRTSREGSVAKYRMQIGRDRRDAIDWVQERMDYVQRPLAELTYFGLVRRGLITEGEGHIDVDPHLDGTTIKDIGRQDYAAREISRTELQRRRSRSSRFSLSSTQKHAKITTSTYTDNAPMPSSSATARTNQNT